ncbi:MAG: hypothetical protein COS68_01095 [Elusimicrobia bacterium CG06_land_8_20_14_3_00_38_11]|nr:MAG: hypothetical protein COS68_01095 [Elusimicrobia bacterium CG06_land_8_20_14_3_00_38_11]
MQIKKWLSDYVIKWLVVPLLLLIHLSTYPLIHCLFAAGFELGAVRPKIITPNGDHKNDMLIVSYDNPNDESNVSGRILTINGSYIADMLVVNSDPDNPKITWNGKDGSSVVPSGIYIYQIEVEGQVLNGTVVVAK